MNCYFVTVGNSDFNYLVLVYADEFGTYKDEINFTIDYNVVANFRECDVLNVEKSKY